MTALLTPAPLTRTMREAFLDVVAEQIDADERITLLLADISAGAVPDLARRHPDRVLNVGIREQLLIGAAGGVALTGLRPVVHTYAPFLVERPYEQIKLDLGHQGVDAVLVSIGASHDAASAGRTHQSPGDVALVDTLPGWAVHVPGHPDEAARILHSVIPGDGSHYVRLSEASNTEAHDAGTTVLRPGRRGVVLAVGPTLDATLEAAAGLDVTVAYTATVRPFDGAGLRAAVGDGPADVVVVEPYLAGTSSRVVADVLSDRPHRQLGLGVGREELRRYGTAAQHDAAHGLDAAGIAASLRAFGL